MDSAYLTTDRYLLRFIVEADLPNLVMLDSQPNVMQFINGGSPTALELWRDTILPTIQGYYKRYNDELGNWIVEDGASKEFIGWFHLRPDKQDLDNRKVLELGYRLTPSSWGKGVATEVSLALIEKAFRDLGAEKVFARAMKGNKGSIRVMEKVGMQFETFFIQDDFPAEDKEAVRYSISKAQWRV